MAEEIGGHCDSAFAEVGQAFAANFARGDEVGAAVTVYVDGRPVVDLWGGVADHKTGRPWQADTPVLTFSCTKAVTATAALMLAERGAVDLTAPVRSWWPEFATAGKDDTTGEHLLAHQAGLPAFDEPVTAADALDPAALAARLAAQAPLWAPGADHGYHALTYGWLAGELVRRHTGRPVGAFLADEIAGDLEMWLGADDELISRTARLTAKRPARTGTSGAPAGPDGPPAPGTPRLKGQIAEMAAAAADPDSLLNRSEGNPAPGPGGYNNPELLRGGWPAAGLIATARGLAGFYRDLLAGRLVSAATLRDAVRPRSSGADRVLKVDSAFGLGFMRPSTVFTIPPAGRDGAFGHTGASGAIGIGDLERGMAMAYVPNRVGDEVPGMRAVHLVNATYRALG